MATVDRIHRSLKMESPSTSAATPANEQQEKVKSCWKRAMDFLWGLRHPAAIVLGLVCFAAGITSRDASSTMLAITMIAYGVWGLYYKSTLPASRKEKQDKIDLLKTFEQELPTSKISDWQSALSTYDTLCKRYEELKVKKVWISTSDNTVNINKGQFEETKKTIARLATSPNLAVNEDERLDLADSREMLCSVTDNFVKSLKRLIRESIAYHNLLTRIDEENANA